MQEITVTMEVPMGHRLQKHEGKCRYLHGHNYLFEISLRGAVERGNGSPSSGMVVDFSVAKKQIKDLLDRMDHAMMLEEKDPYVEILYAAAAPCKLLTMNEAPTAENIAQWVQDELNQIMYLDVQVRVWETRDSSAYGKAVYIKKPSGLIVSSAREE